MKNKLFFIIPLLIPSACAGDSISASSSEQKHYDKHAHVILLSGQSNAVGYSKSVYVLEKMGDEQYAKYNNGPNNTLINYYIVESDNRSMGNNFTKVQFGFGLGGDSFGPEIGMASVFGQHPDEKYYIIKFAKGGSSLSDDWLAESGQAPLYTLFVAFVKQKMDYLREKYPTTEFNIDSLCWMQGETDATGYNSAQNYKNNLVTFMNNLKNDLADYGGNNMVIIDAGISQVWSYYQTVNEAKENAGSLIDNYHYFSTIDMGLEVNKEPAGIPDSAHYDSASMIELGKKLATESLKYFK
ncbi:MAG TPA: sialate O-acetylesterase [Erysipelotrichaceae bacterium]|nr:sialate O-acetylesterase [Erysipelotrichaceae bacterium]